MTERIRRTYMMDKSSLRILKLVKECHTKLINKGIFLKSNSDTINFALGRLKQFLTE